MCSCFQNAYTKEKISSPKGQVWLDMLIQMENVYPDDIPLRPPTSGIRFYCCKLIQSLPFEIFIYFIIFGNLIIMTLPYEGSDQIYTSILDKTSLICTIIFALEALVKIIALDPHYYFSDSWNKFDFAVVISGIVDLGIVLYGFDKLAGIFKTLQVIRLFRLVRVIR